MLQIVLQLWSQLGFDTEEKEDEKKEKLKQDDDKKREQQTEFKLLTLNVFGWRKDESKKWFLDMLQQKEPDIVFLQEDKKPRSFQIPGYVDLTSELTGQGDMANSILTRPGLDAEALPSLNLQGRGLCSTPRKAVAMRRGDLVLVNVHQCGGFVDDQDMKLNHQAKQKEMSQILGFYQPDLIAGDFNSSSTLAMVQADSRFQILSSQNEKNIFVEYMMGAHKELEGNGYTPAYTEATLKDAGKLAFSSEKSQKLVDWIYCHPNGLFEIVEADILDAIGAQASDHNGVWIRFRLRSKTQALDYAFGTVDGLKKMEFNGDYRAGTPAEATSEQAMRTLVPARLVDHDRKDEIVPGVGKVHKIYLWKNKASFLSTEEEMNYPIYKPSVHLSPTQGTEKFREWRSMIQEAVCTQKGLTDSLIIEAMALDLGGLVIEARLPCYSKAWIARREYVLIHCIFQSGLNLTGTAGGGLLLLDPVTMMRKRSTQDSVAVFYRRTADAAVESALRNQSHVLIYNIGIGTGFFAGHQVEVDGKYKPRYREEILNMNVKGLYAALVERLDRAQDRLQVWVPDVGFDDAQRTRLEEVQVRIFRGDKDGVAAYLAASGFRVSKTIAADPMSMLGVHGPGLWWRTAGAASDEERAAYLSGCYILGYIPIPVFEHPATSSEPSLTHFIPALSEFMQEKPTE